jgi:hypothetical protein
MISGPSKGKVARIDRSTLSKLDFGPVAVGSSKTLPIEILNTGNRPLTLSPYYESPSYTVLGTTPENCVASVAPAGTCTLQIQFAPLTRGAHTIQFTLGSNGVADSVTLLEGTGID